MEGREKEGGRREREGREGYAEKHLFRFRGEPFAEAKGRKARSAVETGISDIPGREANDKINKIPGRFNHCNFEECFWQ